MNEILQAEAGYVFLAALYYVFVMYPFILIRRRRRRQRDEQMRVQLAQSPSR